MIRRTALVVHWLAAHPADRDEPTVGYCTCSHPDIQPLGGWWPAAFTCCRACSKPRLET
jgi:hypothetical protein